MVQTHGKIWTSQSKKNSTLREKVQLEKGKIRIKEDSHPENHIFLEKGSF